MDVELIALNREAAVKAAAGDRSLYASASNADTIFPLVEMVAAEQADLYRRTRAAPPWVGYLARDPATNTIVGACSFKDICRDGAVEISYFTFPQAEGRGWGVRMAAALLDVAWREPQVLRILAHTLPEENASTRILRKLAFAHLGTIEDPAEGRAWRWELKRPAG
jgi:ribosomal-protein-alanine N-acetyltransferase